MISNWLLHMFQLLETFKVSEPWKPDNVTHDCDSRKMCDSKLPESSVELERELFKLFCEASRPRYSFFALKSELYHLKK